MIGYPNVRREFARIMSLRGHYVADQTRVVVEDAIEAVIDALNAELDARLGALETTITRFTPATGTGTPRDATSPTISVGSVAAPGGQGTDAAPLINSPRTATSTSEAPSNTSTHRTNANKAGR